MERPKEVWVVKKVENDQWVMIEKSRQSSCQSCGSLAFCQVKDAIDTRAKNTTGKPLNTGQHVLVEVPVQSMGKTAFILYGIPTLALVFSLLFFIEIIGCSQTVGLLYSLAVLAGVFLFIRFYDKIYAKTETNIPKVLAIIPETKPPKEN
jgi:positive regulator of sigma E activity